MPDVKSPRTPSAVSRQPADRRASPAESLFSRRKDNPLLCPRVTTRRLTPSSFSLPMVFLEFHDGVNRHRSISVGLNEAPGSLAASPSGASLQRWEVAFTIKIRSSSATAAQKASVFGLDGGFMKEMGNMLHSGYAALFLLINSFDTNKVVAALRPAGARVLSIRLDETTAEALQAVFARPRAAEVASGAPMKF